MTFHRTAQTGSAGGSRQWLVGIAIALLVATGCSSSGSDDAPETGGAVMLASQYFSDANVDNQVATIGLVITNTTDTQLTLTNPTWETTAAGFTLNSAGYQPADNPDETLNKLPDNPDLASTLTLDQGEAAVLGARFDVDCNTSPDGVLTINAATPDTTETFAVADFAVVSSADPADWPAALHTRVCGTS